MTAIAGQQSRVVSDVGGPLEESAQSAPRVRRQWVAPTWERLETPMEVTMYVARR
jgi:hypothetical protein